MNQGDFRALIAAAQSRPAAAKPGAQTPAGGAAGGAASGGAAKEKKVFKPRKARGAGGDKEDAFIPSASYRDRAAERRVHPTTEAAEDEAVLATIGYEQSKFLGGDLAHTHLVKGLDFALLNKIRSEMEDSEAAEIDAELEHAASSKAGGAAGGGAAKPAESAGGMGPSSAAGAGPSSVSFVSALGAQVYRAATAAERILRCNSAAALAHRARQASALTAERVAQSLQGIAIGSDRFAPARTMFEVVLGGAGHSAADDDDDDGAAPPTLVVHSREDVMATAPRLLDHLDGRLLERLRTALVAHDRSRRPQQAASAAAAREAAAPAQLSSAAAPTVGSLPSTMATSRGAARLGAPAKAAALDDDDDDIFAGAGRYDAAAPALAAAASATALDEEFSAIPGEAGGFLGGIAAACEEGMVGPAPPPQGFSNDNNHYYGGGYEYSNPTAPYPAPAAATAGGAEEGGVTAPYPGASDDFVAPYPGASDDSFVAPYHGASDSYLAASAPGGGSAPPAAEADSAVARAKAAALATLSRHGAAAMPGHGHQSSMLPYPTASAQQQYVPLPYPQQYPQPPYFQPPTHALPQKQMATSLESVVSQARMAGASQAMMMQHVSMMGRASAVSQFPAAPVHHAILTTSSGTTVADPRVAGGAMVRTDLAAIGRRPAAEDPLAKGGIRGSDGGGTSYVDAGNAKDASQYASVAWDEMEAEGEAAAGVPSSSSFRAPPAAPSSTAAAATETRRFAGASGDSSLTAQLRQGRFDSLGGSGGGGSGGGAGGAGAAARNKGGSGAGRLDAAGVFEQYERKSSSWLDKLRRGDDNEEDADAERSRKRQKTDTQFNQVMLRVKEREKGGSGKEKGGAGGDSSSKA